MSSFSWITDGYHTDLPLTWVLGSKFQASAFKDEAFYPVSCLPIPKYLLCVNIKKLRTRKTNAKH